jgi:DNA-binding response OmpR family regulator
MSRLAVIAVPDLMFQPRIEATARELGFETEVADSALSARDALARRPAIVIVDLHAIGLDVETVIRGAKTMGASVLAFGRHTEPAALRDARRAGADLAVARSQLFEELPNLIERLTGDESTFHESEPPALSADQSVDIVPTQGKRQLL